MARDTHGNTVVGWKRLLDSLADKETTPQIKNNRETLQTLYQEALELAASAMLTGRPSRKPAARFRILWSAGAG